MLSEEWIPAKDAAAQFGIDYSELKELVKNERVEARPRARGWLVRKSSMAAALNNYTTDPEKKAERFVAQVAEEMKLHALGLFMAEINEASKNGNTDYTRRLMQHYLELSAESTEEETEEEVTEGEENDEEETQE